MMVPYTVKYRKYGGARIMSEQLNELSFEEPLKKFFHLNYNTGKDFLRLFKINSFIKKDTPYVCMRCVYILEESF